MQQMPRRALFIGIDTYDFMRPLTGPVADMLALEQMLAYHENFTPNYACKHLLSATATDTPIDSLRISRPRMLEALRELFDTEDEVLFAFAGHGVSLPTGVYLATQDGNEMLPGIAMSDILAMANASHAKDVLLIFDCCNAGALGDPLPFASEAATIHFREGLTLVAASRPAQSAREVAGNGMFTQLVIGALEGGGKDIRGKVTSASIYGYVDQALGPWEQRPMYKSNASRLLTVRQCEPDVSGADLQRLPELFMTPVTPHCLDHRYEHSFEEATPECVAIFNVFKHYRDARLLKTTIDSDLFFAAKHCTSAALTPLGKYYWELAKKGLLESDAAFPTRRSTVPDPEAIARLFHETYERLAPSYQYETRKETAVPWEHVPDRNKQLMIAVANVVLAAIFPPEDKGAFPNTSQATIRGGETE